MCTYKSSREIQCVSITFWVNKKINYDDDANPKRDSMMIVCISFEEIALQNISISFPYEEIYYQ